MVIFQVFVLRHTLSHTHDTYRRKGIVEEANINTLQLIDHYVCRGLLLSGLSGLTVKMLGWT